MSSDKSIIKYDDTYKMIGGTTIPIVRRGTIEELNLDISDFIKFSHSGGKWDDYYIMKRKIRKKEKPIPISKSILLKRDNYGFEKYKLSLDSSALRILENMNHFIYDFPLFIIGVGTPLPLRFPSDESRKNAVNFAKEFAKKTDFEIVVGDIYKISKYIDEIL
jgi:hypothetical protein